MPRGIPKAGFRKTQKRQASTQFIEPIAIQSTVEFESDLQIEQKLQERFDALAIMADCTAKGENKSFIVSGPAGLGKSYGVMKACEATDSNVVHVKGYIRPTGLYKMLYENRFDNCVIVFDDSDSIFADDVCLNILKAASDSSKVRKISWLTETRMLDEEGDRMPRSFEFEGSIIFITNYDFDDMIARGSRLAPHFEALISRSHYLDLAMKSKRDYIVRIKQVVRAGMLSDRMPMSRAEEIVSFMEENINHMRELSLRMVNKLADLRVMNELSWKKLAKVTCMR